MQENKQDKYEFISEKIKEKPVNKKKLVYHVCFVVLLAVLFGIVASVTFVLCQPKIDGMLHPKQVYRGSDRGKEQYRLVQQCL